MSNMKGKIIAVDIEAWLHAAASHKAYIDALFLEPEVPIQEAVDYVAEYIELFKKHEVIPICCFGGSRHKAKAAEDTDRNNSSTLAQEAYKEFIALPFHDTAAEYATLDKLKKDGSYVREA